VITSGNEVGRFEDQPPQPWQLRNSNRLSISSVLQQPGLDVIASQHCLDDQAALAETLRSLLSRSDAVILSGGVSMGDYDFVPDVVKQVGGEICFHGLPIRPGKPILGAATDSGQLILGLPGNPVSATVGAHRFSLPLLRKLGGQVAWHPPCPVVRLADAGETTIPLHWMRLVRITDHGLARPVISQGSGDLVSLGQSSGYVEMPPDASGEGPWPYHAWL
jgi:molybdenum cofactor synthesis domain-containing protein